MYFPETNNVSSPLIQHSLEDSKNHPWLNRHADWVKEKMVSNHRFERVSAKIWSVAFPILMALSVVFIYHAFQFRKFLNASQPIQSRSNSPQGLSSLIDTREAEGSDEIQTPREEKKYLDGDCQNFLKEPIYQSYLTQLKTLLKRHPQLKKHIDSLPGSNFKESAERLYNHLLSKPVSEDMNQEHQIQLMAHLRAYQIEASALPTDIATDLVRKGFDGFIQDYMKEVVCYQPSMDFLNQLCQEHGKWNGQMGELTLKLKEIYNKVKENADCDGIVPGLFDPFELGNLPYQTFQLYTNDKTIHVFRCSNIVRDEEKEEKVLTKASIGEQFKMYLDACRREGKKHLYVNLMLRHVTGNNETLRSKLIEDLEVEYSGTLNVVSLDRNSDFYLQKGAFKDKNDAVTFKNTLKKHLGNKDFYYWSKDLNEAEWQIQLDTIVEEIYAFNFSGQAELTLEQRQAFIELTYVKIIEALLKATNSDSCNYTCKSCIDRGGITNAIMYLYSLYKKNGRISPDEFNYLLY